MIDTKKNESQPVLLTSFPSECHWHKPLPDFGLNADCYSEAKPQASLLQQAYGHMHTSIMVAKLGHRDLAEKKAVAVVEVLNKYPQYCTPAIWSHVHLLLADLLLNESQPNVQRVRLFLNEACNGASARYPMEPDGVRAHELLAHVEFSLGNNIQAAEIQSVALDSLTRDPFQVAPLTIGAGIVLLKYLGASGEHPELFKSTLRTVGSWSELSSPCRQDALALIGEWIMAADRTAFNGAYEQAYELALRGITGISKLLAKDPTAPVINYQGFFESFAAAGASNNSYYVAVGQKYITALIEAPLPDLDLIAEWTGKFATCARADGRLNHLASFSYFVAEKILAREVFRNLPQAKETACAMLNQAAYTFLQLEEVQIAETIITKVKDFGLKEGTARHTDYLIVEGFAAIKKADHAKAFVYFTAACDSSEQATLFDIDTVLGLRAEAAIFAGYFDIAKGIFQELWDKKAPSDLVGIATLHGLESRLHRQLENNEEALRHVRLAKQIFVSLGGQEKIITQLMIQEAHALHDLGSLQEALVVLEQLDERVSGSSTELLWDQLAVCKLFVDIAESTDDIDLNNRFQDKLTRVYEAIRERNPSIEE